MNKPQGWNTGKRETSKDKAPFSMASFTSLSFQSGGAKTSVQEWGNAFCPPSTHTQLSQQTSPWGVVTQKDYLLPFPRDLRMKGTLITISPPDTERMHRSYTPLNKLYKEYYPKGRQGRFHRKLWYLNIWERATELEYNLKKVKSIYLAQYRGKTVQPGSL